MASIHYVTNKLVVLADKLDRLGLKKYADKVDRMITTASRGDGADFDELTKLFDEPVEFEDSEEDGPVRQHVIDESREYEDPASTEPDEPVSTKKEPSRLEQIKKRHELLRLKKSIEKAEENEPVEDFEDEVRLPVATQEDLKAFEDEDENEADDGLLETLKEKLKEAPELAVKLLTLVKDNPELLELLAL